MFKQFYPNHMHIHTMKKHMQSFKTIVTKLSEELRSQEVPIVYILRVKNE